MRQIIINLDSSDKTLIFRETIRQGENLGSEIIVNLNGEFAGYHYLMRLKLNSNETMPTSELIAVNNQIKYPIPAILTAEAGILKVVFEAYEEIDESNTRTIKSAVTTLKIAESLDGGTEIVPEDYVPWYTQAVEQASIATTQAGIATTKAEEAGIAAANAVAGIQAQFDNVVAGVTVDSEVIIARDGETTLGNNITKIKEQINNLDTQKSNITYVDIKVAAVASGSPKGVFATVELLQADATANTVDGKKNIYIVINPFGDGKDYWYYWNGTMWTSGGVYQSTGIGDNEVTPEKTTFFTIDKAENRYNPANQTEQTITKDSLIYRTGEIAAYISPYWVTAPIYLEGGKYYTMMVALNSGQSSSLLGAIYDANNNYIQGVAPEQFDVTGDSVTFYMPVNGAYIKTTVYGSKFAVISIDMLNNFNAQFMIVESTTLPIEYSKYYPTVYSINDGYYKNYFKPIYMHLDNDIINVISKYGTNNDIRLEIMKKGPNSLFDFYRWYKITNANIYPSDDVSMGTQFAENSTDFFGPYQVMATTNIDGDNKDVNGNYLPNFTGGNHSYNNLGTAYNESYKVYADGKEVQNAFSGYCNFIDLIWINKVQAYNTTKSDGTGRVVLTEKIHLHFNGYKWDVENEITGLETIGFTFYYGMQAFVRNFSKTNVYFCGSRVNRGANNVGVGDVNSGDKNCVAIKSIGVTDTLEFGIDNTFDLGTFDNSIYAYSAHGSYEKCYFDLIEQTPSNKIILNTNDKMGYRGYYKFYPTI